MVAKIVPEEIHLNHFFYSFCRYKGELDILLESINRLKSLKDGDKILIAEACSHHIQKTISAELKSLTG